MMNHLFLASDHAFRWTTSSKLDRACSTEPCPFFRETNTSQPSSHKCDKIQDGFKNEVADKEAICLTIISHGLQLCRVGLSPKFCHDVVFLCPIKSLKCSNLSISSQISATSFRMPKGQLWRRLVHPFLEASQLSRPDSNGPLWNTKGESFNGGIQVWGRTTQYTCRYDVSYIVYKYISYVIIISLYIIYKYMMHKILLLHMQCMWLEYVYIYIYKRSYKSAWKYCGILKDEIWTDRKSVV